jgi:hypothetical protein
MQSSKEKTMSTTDTSTTEQPEYNHCGIFQVAATAMQHLMPEISIDNTDTQGHLRDTDVFTRLHDRFLLPDGYTVRNIFYEHLRGVWNVFIESPDLPDCNVFSQEDFDFPRIEPVYCSESDGTVHLVEIKVHAQRTVPVTGGIQWLLKAI